MTSEEKTKEFLEMFPDCPNPENQPKQVEYLVKLYNFYKKREEDSIIEV